MKNENSKKSPEFNRRSFLKKLSIGFLGASVTGMIFKNPIFGFLNASTETPKLTPPASCKKVLTESSDPKIAKKSQYYVAEAKNYGKTIKTAPKISKKKLFVGSNCSNCSFYKQVEDTKFGKCSILANKCAAASGMCKMYAPQPKWKKTAKKIPA